MRQHHFHALHNPFQHGSPLLGCLCSSDCNITRKLGGFNYAQNGSPKQKSYFSKLFLLQQTAPTKQNKPLSQPTKQNKAQPQPTKQNKKFVATFSNKTPALVVSIFRAYHDYTSIWACAFLKEAVLLVSRTSLYAPKPKASCNSFGIDTTSS